jgi:hypothetical protein
MKKLSILIPILLSIMMFSSPSYSEWKKMEKISNGDILYIDFDKSKKLNGYVYWDLLKDFLKPTLAGGIKFNSIKFNIQGDCKLNKIKFLTLTMHKEPMGKDEGIIDNFPQDEEWRDASTHPSFGKYFLKVCNYKK